MTENEKAEFEKLTGEMDFDMDRAAVEQAIEAMNSQVGDDGHEYKYRVDVEGYLLAGYHTEFSGCILISAFLTERAGQRWEGALVSGIATRQIGSHEAETPVQSYCFLTDNDLAAFTMKVAKLAGPEVAADSAITMTLIMENDQDVDWEETKKALLNEFMAGYKAIIDRNDVVLP